MQNFSNLYFNLNIFNELCYMIEPNFGIIIIPNTCSLKWIKIPDLMGMEKNEKYIDHLYYYCEVS